MAKRNQKPEVRKAQREQAVRAAKDQKKATVKKPVVKVRLVEGGSLCQFCRYTPVFLHMSKNVYSFQDKAAQKAQKATKNVQKAGPGRVGGKR